MSDEWEKIKRALENPNYKWRTLEGIAKETKSPVVTITSTFAAHADEVLKSAIPSTDGRELYTTRDHYRQRSTLWDRLESVITNKVQK